MNIIVFGSGKAARIILRYKKKVGVNILFVCDNDKSRWGQRICDYTIVSPDRIMNSSYDNILLAMWNGWALNEIVEQLINMGVPQSKMVFSHDPSIARYCTCALDDFFVIPKVPYDVRFSKNTVTLRDECFGETSKAHDRRVREGFFDKYCRGEGLDIGCGADPVTKEVSCWELLNGDAQYLREIDDNSFDFVYSSHCLEHMRDVRVALYNWYRVVKPGGYLIVAVPDRDLYEKKKCLPSRWNGDHRHMFLVGRSEEPDTLDLLEELDKSITNYELEYIKLCDEGHTITDPFKQSDGEYQIEMVVRKL